MEKPSKPISWEEANKLVDLVQERVRIELAPYSTEQLLKMLEEGKNPLRGDKP